MKTAALLLLSLAAASPARAQGGDFSDAAIEQRKADLDRSFAQVQLEADREFQDSVAFHARLKQERLDFERERLSARKRMLDSLRGLPAGQRKAEYERFHGEDLLRRAEFSKRVAGEKAVFRRRYLEVRQEARREAKGSRSR